MGKQRKARRRSLRPPLSLLDKSIYWAGFLVSLVFAGALYIFILRLLDIIAFRDPSVIAYKSHGTHLFTIPFLLYLGLSPFIFILFSLESRKPIFGSRKIRYGETPREKRLLSYIRSETETCPYLTVPKSPSPPDSAVMADRSAFYFSDRFFRSFRPCLSNAGAPYHKL